MLGLSVKQDEALEASRRRAPLPLELCCNMLGAIWEDVTPALVGAYWRLEPSTPNLAQFRIDINYACWMMQVWAQGRVVIGAHKIVLSDHHQAALVGACGALHSCSALKAWPLEQVLALLKQPAMQVHSSSTRIDKTLATYLKPPADTLQTGTGKQQDAMGISTAHVSCHPMAISTPHAKPTPTPLHPVTETNMTNCPSNHKMQLHKVGSPTGPSASFSDTCPPLGQMEMRMLDVSVPEIAVLVSCALRGRPELQPMPFPPLQQSDASAVQEARCFIAAHSTK